jgi:hypothetical protein
MAPRPEPPWKRKISTGKGAGKGGRGGEEEEVRGGWFVMGEYCLKLLT